ncbi:MAG: redox-regulated ATPase YchF [Anaerolineales bacterium]
MTLQLGLVGLPNVGKSTLFNALTEAGAAVASYPFTTIEPNVGVVPVPDERLSRIAEIIQPERVTPTTLRVVDIAGLVEGANRGEGLGNQFLSHIRNVDAIAMVVRCFRDENVAHVTEELGPVEDMETIELELILADLDILERREEEVRQQARTHPQDFAAELDILEWVSDQLRQGKMIRDLDLFSEQRKHLQDLALLTDKPVLYVANVDEQALPHGGALAEQVKQKAEAKGSEAIVLCAVLEAELITWPGEEARAYLAEFGIERGLDRFIRAGYRLLDYITFFTTTGGHEVRAWTLQRGQTALEAAGRIHTDMERGFIRAEVVQYEDLIEAGSMRQAREAGALRVEGRDYMVQDGDILHIRFAT